MATKAFEGEKLELEDLEKVVAGAAMLDAPEKEDETKKKTTVIDGLAQEDAPKPAKLGMGWKPTGGGFIDNGSTGTGGIFNIDPGPTGGGFIQDTKTRAPDSILHDATAKLKTDVFNQIGMAKSPDQLKGGIDGAVQQCTMKLAKELNIDVESASALAWSSLYKVMYEGPTPPGKGNVIDAVKANVVSHIEQVSKGIAAEVGITGDLKASLSRSSDALAQALVGASETAAAEIKAKAILAYEKGLDVAKETPIGKNVMSAIDDPKNVENWKEMYANAAWIVMSPTWVTPAKFLLDQMASQATAKAIGLGDFPSEMKQTAAAMASALDNVGKAFVDIYKTGFVAAFTMGLDVKGIINIGLNMGEMGKAIWAGDAGALGRAAQALVTDMLYDVRDGLKSFYVDAPTKAFEWTKTLTMDVLDKLGATPYAELAVKETEKAFVEFGNLARDGCVEAVNTLADFATNDVAGAFNTVEKLAREGVNGAINAVEDAAKEGLNAATTLITDLAKSGSWEAMESAARLIVLGVPGALAEISGATRHVMATINILDMAVQQGSTAALNALTDAAKDVSNQFQYLFVQKLQGAVVNEVAGAADRLVDLVNQGVPYAQEAAQAVFQAGGAAAMEVYDGLKTAYGAAEDATKAIEWAAKYVHNEIGEAAINEITDIANSGGQYAADAIYALSDVAQAGGRYAMVAIEELKSLAQYSDVARDALEDAANAGVSYAERAYREVTDALKSVWDKINPANWWPW